MALRKGDGLIEFFSNLPLMREMYEKKGIVVAKRMYEILKDDGKISMGYKNFAVLFSKHLAPKKEPVIATGLTPKNEEVTVVKSAADHAPVESIEEAKRRPMIVKTNQSNKPKFNSSSVKIDPENEL